MLKEKLLDFFSSMNGGPIPQQENRSPKMPEEIFEEGTGIQAREIPRAKIEIKGQTFPFRGHRQSTEDGDSILFVKMIEEGRLAFGRPGSGDIGNKQKSRLIDEDQMGSKFFGVFLYAASGSASNGRSLLPSFAKLGVQVSGNSTPSLPEVSTRGRGDIERRIVGRSLGPRGLKSINPSGNQRPGVPSGAPLPVGSFVPGTAWADAQESVEALILVTLSPGTPEANGIPNSQRRLRPAPRPTDSCPLLGVGGPVGAAFPTVERFPGVSCPIV